jgi:hypothetical protein
MFIIEYLKAEWCHVWQSNPNFSFDLHLGIFTSEHLYVTKIAQNDRMGGLWRDYFIDILISTKAYLCWNKILKHIMSWCGMNF